MLKKIVISGAVVAVVSFVVFGTSAFSHLTQGVDWVRGQVDESIPLEYKLDQARDLIEKTAPQIRECKRVIAEKQVEIKYLERDLTGLERKATSSKVSLKAKSSMLQDVRPRYHFASRTVSRDELKHDTARHFARVRAADARIGSLTQRLDALRGTLDAARSTLDELKTQRENLVTVCATLEAKLQETEAKKAMTLDLDVDDSNLAEAKAILMDVEKRLDVDIQMMRNSQPLIDERPSTLIIDEDLPDQISAYLDGPAPIRELPAATEAVAEIQR